MSLSRWSNSRHYIYLVDPGVIMVEGFGQFTSKEITIQYSEIENRAKRESYTWLERFELRMYLKSWVHFRYKLISYDAFNTIIQGLGLYGEIKKYVEDPWLCYNKIPTSLQVKVCPKKPVSDKVWFRHLAYQAKKMNIELQR